MNKLTQLFLALFLMCLPMAMNADSLKDKKDDTRYLAGAVPEVDGKVVFSKEYQISGMTQAQIYEKMQKWLEDLLKENKNQDSRVVYQNEQEGVIAGVGEEWLVFRSSALSLDRSLINYQITITCKPGNCVVDIEKIRFTYREKEKYTAEEWITDKYALNKTKTKLITGLAKWRRKTVDFADEIFNSAAGALGAPVAKLKKVEQEEKVTAGTGPVVINANIGKEAKDMPGYVETNVKQIPGDVYALMSNSKVVINIGTDDSEMTTIIAKAGGALGNQSGKAVAYCSLSPDQSSEIMDKAENYTIKLFAADQTTPAAIIVCKKLQNQDQQAGQPKTYVGEIVRILIKK